MSAGFAAAGRVAIAGYAHSRVVRRSDRPLGALTLEVARAAIADAGLTPEQIDGFVTAALFPTAGAHAVVDGVSTVSAAWLARRIAPAPRYVAGFAGIGQLPGAVALAVNAIAAGAADYVLLHRALHNPAGGYHDDPSPVARGDQQWTRPQGFGGPLPMIALPYTEYLQRYHADPEALAGVAVEARANGAALPWSYWHGRPLTAAEYLDSPLVSDPVRRIDCDLPVQGAAAFVLTSAERARDLPHPPVYVAGYASAAPAGQRLPLHWPLDDIMAGGREVRAALEAATGLRSTEIDLPQLYDGFSPFVYFWLEALGLCPPGEAHRFVAAGGIDSAAGGLPVLSGGGALGTGRMHGIPQMLECYLQLAGRAGERARPADTAVACQSAPHFGGAVAYSREPLRTGGTTAW